MKKNFLLSLSLFITAVLSAQVFDFTVNQSWAEKPLMHNIHKPYDSASAAGILDERKVEYRNEKDNIFIYEYTHNIVRIHNDNGIEMFNKIYIQVYNNSQIQSIRARTIFPNGKIIELNADNIKEIEEDGQIYKLFALEGLEKGCEVEYAYTLKRSLNLFGSKVFQRNNMPYLHTAFTLITPAYLKFDAKGYNGFKVSKDSVIGEQRFIAGYSNDVDEMEDEKYAQPDTHLQRVDYKLSYNLNKNANVRLYTWKEFAKQLFTSYTTRSAKEEKSLDALVSKIQVPQNAAEGEKILAI
ncbi:MAG: DUF3857 domain-containing protein, partial [Panacibacter sp.]